MEKTKKYLQEQLTKAEKEYQEWQNKIEEIKKVLTDLQDEMKQAESKSKELEIQRNNFREMIDEISLEIH